MTRTRNSDGRSIVSSSDEKLNQLLERKEKWSYFPSVLSWIVYFIFMTCKLTYLVSYIWNWIFIKFSEIFDTVLAVLWFFFVNLFFWVNFFVLQFSFFSDSLFSHSQMIFIIITLKQTLKALSRVVGKDIDWDLLKMANIKR